MPIRTTPNLSASSRGLYEQAHATRDETLQRTIELDTLIENTQLALLSNSLHPRDLLPLLGDVEDEVIRIATSTSHHTANFTDVHRLYVTAYFAREKILMPLLFAGDAAVSESLRRSLANGMAGKSVDAIASLLDEHATLRDVQHVNARKRLRGAIQEDTFAALINDRQDGQVVALSSSFMQDTREGIDLTLYYVDPETHQSYSAPISIKSDNEAILVAKSKRPYHIVLGAAGIHNMDLRISDLLVRQAKGSPGLTPEESQQLDEAKQTVHRAISAQLNPQTIQPIPHISATKLASLHAALVQ